AKVEIKVDGETVKISGLGEPIRLRAGKHHLLVTSGNFETVSESFTVSKGNNPVLKVSLRPKEGAGPPPVVFFNGKDLTGWQGLPQHWTVKDGGLVGSTLPGGINFNTFLCSAREYRDFEVKFQVWLKGGKGNSGLQIRSQLFDTDK